MTEALYLAEDVFFCVTEGHGVFLDLKRDAYSAVMFTGDDQVLNGITPPSSLLDRLAPQSVDLIAAGLLTTDPHKAAPVAVDAGIERPEAHIFGLDDQRAFGLAGEAAIGLRVTLRDVAEFFLASWIASRNLKTRHIAAIVEAVRRRKARAGSRPVDLDELRRQMRIFRRLRPWYPRNYLCLYDSLALVEFLARRRLYPLWVFAVQAQPFGAHCWVQAERLLLNEGTEYAGQFTPIMAV